MKNSQSLVGLTFELRGRVFLRNVRRILLIFLENTWGLGSSKAFHHKSNNGRESVSLLNHRQRGRPFSRWELGSTVVNDAREVEGPIYGVLQLSLMAHIPADEW